MRRVWGTSWVKIYLSIFFFKKTMGQFWNEMPENGRINIKARWTAIFNDVEEIAKVKWNEKHSHCSFHNWWGIQAQITTKIYMYTSLSNKQVYSHCARAEKKKLIRVIKKSQKFFLFLAARSAPKIEEASPNGIDTCVKLRSARPLIVKWPIFRVFFLLPSIQFI